MKVEVLRESLVAGLGTVTRAGKLKSVLPVLGMVLLDARQSPEGGVLNLMCTDLEVSLEHRILARVEAEGKIAVPHRLFRDLSATIPDGQVTLETEDETVTLRMTNSDGSNRSSIKCLEAGEFPTIPREARASITMPACGPFLDAVRQVSFAAEQREGTRPVLEGVLVAIAGEQITLVATDGLRLAARKITVPGIERDEVEDEWLAIVPSRSLAHLPNVVGDTDAPLTVVVLKEGRLAFECGPVRMTTNVIAGKYFVWSSVIPTRHTLSANFDVKAMRRAVRSMAVFGQGFDKPTIRVSIDPDGQVVVRGEDQEMGGGSAVVDAEVEGKALVTAMNAGYLDDALKSIGLDHTSAWIEATASTAPVTIRPKGDEEYLKHVIMPSVIRSM